MRRADEAGAPVLEVPSEGGAVIWVLGLVLVILGVFLWHVMFDDRDGI